MLNGYIMHKIIEKLHILDKKLANVETSSLGLFYGKTGFCLYFYLKNRFTGNKEYELVANKLINDITSNIDSLKQYDMKHGLSGIGIGIGFLIDHKFVKGDSNQILSDMDAELFKQLSFPVNSEKLDFSARLQILYYFIVRLKKQKAGGEQEWLFRELIIRTINRLCEEMNFDICDEPLTFNAGYPLPQYLFMLGCCMDLYKDKIYQIVRELSIFLLSKLPLLHSNRLYLLWAINEMNKRMGMKDLESHCLLLCKELEMEKIINEELSFRNIFFNNGLPAIYLLINNLPDYFSESEINQYRTAIIDKIIQSPEWDCLGQDDDYFKMKSGLLDGYCGTSLLLHYHENQFK